MRVFEKFNIATGFILVIVGIIYFIAKAYLTAFSWFIFGSMYLVMDSYKPMQEEQKFERRVALLRKVFSVIGFFASAMLFAYTLISLTLNYEMRP